MKKILSVLLCVCMIVLLAACGTADAAPSTAGSAGGETTAAKTADNVFMAGFGMVDITPKESVPMASYGDDRDRWSEGFISYLEARAVVLKDTEGNLLVFVIGDITWATKALADNIRKDMAYELKIPENNIIVSGTHTHNSVSTSLVEFPSVVNFNKQYVKGMEDAIRMAVEDLKPAEVYVGSVMTENMNFVRRYFMDDGSLDGDNAYGTGTKRVEHETEADPEMQIMKFVREGGKDIVMTQFQAHPHLEGKQKTLSAQTVGAIRDALEKELDVHAFHWQGAAGNLNSKGSLEGEQPFESSNKGRIAYGEKMCEYVKSVYDDLTKVKTGTVKVEEITITAEVNHMYDHMLNEAKKVQDYFKSGHTAAETATYAHQFTDGNGLRINSYYHANRIVSNASQGATKDMTLYSWSFGDVAGVVIPYELFDTSAMQIKEQSPFVRTFIVGYSYPSYGGYIPTKEGYANGGYEADNSNFAPGTAEAMVDAYLQMLNKMYES